MNYTKDRTWAEISLDNIEHNYRVMRALLPPECRFLGVVKADAYGHGALKVAHLLEELHADYLAVATLAEAVELRQDNITLPIIIFGCTPPAHRRELAHYDLTQTVYDPDMAAAFSQAAGGIGKTLKIHLKIDSGMGRLGFTEPGQLLAAMSLPGIYIEGAFTHFAVSDEQDGQQYTRMQFDKFQRLVTELETASGRSFKIKHCANSGAVLNYPYTHMDMVRPGIALYGGYSGAASEKISLKPAMQLKTRIVQIRTLKPGESVSYGRTYTAEKTMKVAVIPIGYADGLHRNLSGKIDVLVHGIRAKQIGRICMDMCMIDVTDIQNVSVCDVVTIFGCDGSEYITAAEQADKAGTISYELLCAVSKRVPRVYTVEGSNSQKK